MGMIRGIHHFHKLVFREAAAQFVAAVIGVAEPPGAGIDDAVDLRVQRIYVNDAEGGERVDGGCQHFQLPDDIVGQVSVIIKVISHELGIILDDDAQLFGTGDEIPDLLAGLAQGHRLQAGLPLLCADNGKNIENREHQNDDHYSGYIEFHQRTKEPGQLFFHTHHLQL